jgi:hypothetical protein
LGESNANVEMQHRSNSATRDPNIRISGQHLTFCVIYFYLCIPETKGRSLEELDELFEAKVPARKFVGHSCQIVEDAKQDVFANREMQQTKNDA